MPDRLKMNLKGPVRTVTTESGVGEDSRSQEHVFNEAGLLINVPSFTETIQNEDGSRTETQNIPGVGAWSMEQFGDTGIGTYGATVARTVYDSGGNPVETLFMTSTNEPTAKIRYVNNSQGKVVEAIQTIEAGFISMVQSSPSTNDRPININVVRNVFRPGMMVARLVLARDEAGRIIETTAYLLGAIVSHKIKTYNEQGDVATIQERENPPISFTYEYDSHGNWIRQTQSTGAPSEITRRITYFE